MLGFIQDGQSHALTALRAKAELKNQAPAFEGQMSTAPSPVLDQSQAAALKNVVMFGAGQPEKLTYEHVKTVQDSILGEIQVYRFSNGMEFYGVRRDDVPLVSYGELIKTGSANETAETNGASHFLEHLIFKGTKNLKPGEADRILEGLGAGLNAFTWLDETFYYVYDMPKESLGEAIRVWAELLSDPAIPQEEMDRERHAVAEEIRRDKQDPEGRLLEKLLASVWPTSRSKWSTLGPMANILTEKPGPDGQTHHLTRDQIMRFVNHFYDPSNRAIVVVGDFDLKETLDRVAYEHEIRPFKGQKAFRTPRPLRPGKVETDTLVRHNVQVAQLMLGFNGPARDAADSEKKLAALELLSVILGQGGSSRLHRALVETPGKRLATDVGMDNYVHKHDNMVYLSAQIRPEDMEAARAAIRTVIEDVAQNGVTERELAKAVKMKKRATASVVEQQRNLMSDLAIQIAQGRLEDSYGGRMEKYYSQITPADIQAVAREFLNAEAERSSALVPKKFQRPASAQPARPAAVQFGGALSAKDKSVTLPGGTEVVVREKPGNINTAVSLVIKGGRRMDSIPGELTVLADMLQRGTRNQTAVELNERLDEEGISFGTEADNDSLVLTFQSLSEDKDKLLAFIEELLGNPAFRPEDLEFIKSKMRDDYHATADTKPPAVAADLLQQELYGADHPYGYGRQSEAMIARLDDITPEHLETAFYNTFTQPNITISGVGDLTLEELSEAARGWTASLPAIPVEAPSPGQKAIPQSRVVTRSKEGLHQSEIFRAWRAPDVHNEDRVPLLVLNYILSGGITARLFQAFREGAEKALCYSVYSHYNPSDQGGDFRFYIGTDPQNTRLVMDMFQNEVRKLIDAPVSDTELKTAKLQLKSGMLSDAQSTLGVSTYLANHRALNVLSHEELLAAIDQVTPADLQAVAEKYLSQPSTTVVLAPKADLEKAGLPVNGSQKLDY